MSRGYFVTFEGVEGCGKTTQLHLLKDFLVKRGFAVTATREPGGTTLGDQIRTLLLASVGALTEMDSKAELLLIEASRAQHVYEVIAPALHRGNIVLCDRFSDATLAYQGYAQGLAKEWIDELNRFASGSLIPDVTILLDCPVQLGLARTRARVARSGSTDHYDRFESKCLSFHEQVRHGYLEIAQRNPDRIIIVDGSSAPAAVHAIICQAVLGRLKSL